MRDNGLEGMMVAGVAISASVRGRWCGLAMVLALLATAWGTLMPATAQEAATESLKGTSVQQIASDLYFFRDYDGSNAVFLVADEGVLVVDTRQHPRAGHELLDHIRKITIRPIRWVINSHFHGDHTFGNAAFRGEGVSFAAHVETARIMQLVHPKEMARRGSYFKSHDYDPNDVKLVLPDVTFDKSMTIRLGGREVRLLYLGRRTAAILSLQTHDFRLPRRLQARFWCSGIA